MKNKENGLLFMIILFFILIVSACKSECECVQVENPTPSQTLTITPGIEQILSTTPQPTRYWLEEKRARATYAATAHMFPTEPSGFPSPLPPVGEFQGKNRPYSYAGDIHFIDHYVIRSWRDHFNDCASITISSLDQPQEEISTPYYSTNELSGVDINMDGFPEYIIYTSMGGNVCAYETLIYSLGDELRLLNGRIIRCMDYFEDVNHDGVPEYITKNTMPLALSQGYRYFMASTIWQYDEDLGYVNVSARYPDFYQDAIAEAQIDIDEALIDGELLPDYVYYQAMIYVYSGRKAKALEVMGKYLDDEHVAKGCEYLLDLEYCELKK